MANVIIVSETDDFIRGFNMEIKFGLKHPVKNQI